MVDDSNVGRIDGFWVPKKALIGGGFFVLMVLVIFGSYYVYKKIRPDEHRPPAPESRADVRFPGRDALFYRYSRLMFRDDYKPPANRKPVKKGVFILLDEGSAWARKRDFDRAIVKYDQAIRLDPDNHWAYFKRGCSWMAKADYDKAIKDFDEAILLEPDRTHTHFYYVFRANCYCGKNEYDRAIKEFDDAIRLSPNNTGNESLFYRGHAWAAKKEFDKAIRDFDEFLQKTIGKNGDGELPSIWFPYIERGIVWSAKKDHEKAINDFEKAIKSLDEWIRLLKDRIGHDDAPDQLDAVQKNLVNNMLVFCYDDLAWLLATCSEDRVRDGNRAVQLAKLACELSNWKKGWELSTLAAAYAEAGQFDEAERHQAQASEDPEYREKSGDDFRRRLEVYKQKKPLRQMP